MNRSAYAGLQRLFSPADEHRLVAQLFLRALALIYFAAFASLAVQIQGLAGGQGILPFATRLDGLHEQLGAAAYWRIPTLFWLSSSDPVLVGAAVAGCGFSLLLLVNILPRLCLILLFALYLSLFHAGQIFMNFQWDYLLLEAGLLAILFSIGGYRLVIWLFHWLLFRLRFESGAAKLLSGDPTWADFSALKYYFETQPLPHWGSWYADRLPDLVLRSGVGLVFFAELFVPLLIFLPRPFRLFAASVTLLVQLLILLTSNHNFFNLLTMALCLFLFDDRAIARLLPWSAPGTPAGSSAAGSRRLRQAAVGAAAAVIVATSSALMWELFSGSRLPSRVDGVIGYVRSFGVTQRYHVFPTIKTERLEVSLEGSMDGERWLPYGWRYKPQELDRMPAFIVPYQPRLDWMMWFVTISLPMNAEWLDGFIKRLFENSPPVTALLARNPFAAAPPRFIRAQVYRYRFATADEKRASGRWWQREPLGPLVPFPWVNPAPPVDH